MLTVVEPIEVLKGSLRGPLILHQLGGQLPDGRSFKLWGAPEYVPGREVIVFAIARVQGEYQTSEMLLGKFEVQNDERGVAFAVPALAVGHAQVTVQPRRKRLETDAPLSTDPARELSAMLRSLRLGARETRSTAVPRDGCPRRPCGRRRNANPAGVVQHLRQHQPCSVEPADCFVGAAELSEHHGWRDRRGYWCLGRLDERSRFDYQLHNWLGEHNRPRGADFALRVVDLLGGCRRHRLWRTADLIRIPFLARRNVFDDHQREGLGTPSLQSE